MSRITASSGLPSCLNTVGSGRNMPRIGFMAASLQLLRVGRSRLLALAPIEMLVDVRFLRHQRAQAALRQLALERLSNPGVLGGQLDLIPIEILGPLAVAAHPSRHVQGQVAGWLCADVEMLVEPAIRRRERGAGSPGNDVLGFA